MDNNTIGIIAIIYSYIIIILLLNDIGRQEGDKNIQDTDLWLNEDESR